MHHNVLYAITVVDVMRESLGTDPEAEPLIARVVGSTAVPRLSI